MRVGLLGSYGNRWVNKSLGDSDFLLVVGSRLDVRQTGADTTGFVTGKKVFHIDIEPGELNNRVSGCETLVAELNDFFAAATRISNSGLRSPKSCPNAAPIARAFKPRLEKGTNSAPPVSPVMRNHRGAS